jgi:hypothetical protein
MDNDDFIKVIYRCIRDSITDDIEWVELNKNKIKILTKTNFEPGVGYKNKDTWIIDSSSIIKIETDNSETSVKKKKSIFSFFFK